MWEICELALTVGPAYLAGLLPALFPDADGGAVHSPVGSEELGTKPSVKGNCEFGDAICKSPSSSAAPAW